MVWRVFIVLNIVIFHFGCSQSSKEIVYKGEKIKGLSMVAPPMEIGVEAMDSMRAVNAGWVSFMPYAFVPKNKSEVRYVKPNTPRTERHQWWGETPEGVQACIKMAHAKGLKVMLKPHLWLGWGQFTGDLNFETDAEWTGFEKSFSSYIMQYALIAEREQVEGFCVATEMASHVRKNPGYWYSLIAEIKKVYKGKLTYAENWDSYQKVPFWSELDFIGIDAYFPLSGKENPSGGEIKKAWKKHVKNMNEYASEQGKPILFTEIGYRSNDYALEKPWEADFSKGANQKIQAEALQVFFEAVWPQPWFAGCYIWKWFPFEQRRHEDTFTPQGKLAQKVIRSNFK